MLSAKQGFKFLEPLLFNSKIGVN